jgi:hypothetical protein
VAWDVEFHGDFVREYEAMAVEVQDELLALMAVLEIFGPQLGRPRVDTLFGSRHANIKSCASTRRTASGGSHSPSTRKGEPSCCAVATSPAEVNGGSTGSSSAQRTSASMPI